MIDCCPVCGLSRALHYNPGDTDHAYEEFHPDRALDEMRGIRLASESHGKLPEDKDVEKFMNLAGALDTWLSERGKLPVSWARKIDRDNWTGGLAASSPKFLELMADVERIIFDSSYSLIHGDAKKVARDILFRLAHTHGLVPGGQS